MTLLLDLDGTVIDSTEAIVESFYVALKHFGFSGVTQEQIVKQIGYPLDVMFANVGVEKEKVWDYVAAYKQHYREISKAKTFMLPNATEAIKEASKFARLGVVTTKTARYSKELLEHFGVMEYFEVLIGREDVNEPKPSSEPILKALQAMQIAPSKSVYMIGDTKMDLLAAQNAGVQGIGVLSGYGSKEELQNYTDLLFDELFDAVMWLKKEKNSHNLADL